jgi:hypothetical protein
MLTHLHKPIERSDGKIFGAGRGEQYIEPIGDRSLDGQSSSGQASAVGFSLALAQVEAVV